MDNNYGNGNNYGNRNGNNYGGGNNNRNNNNNNNNKKKNMNIFTGMRLKLKKICSIIFTICGDEGV